MIMRYSILLSVIILNSIGVIYNGYSNGTSGEHATQLPIVGVSLPNQRSIRWVYDTQIMKAFTSDKGISLQLLFSDDNPVYQAYQIERLIASDIDILIVSAENHESIRSALALAKSKRILVVAYHTLITDTNAIDLFVAYDEQRYGDALYEVNIIDLGKVINRKIPFLYYFDSRVLAEMTCYHALRLYSNRKYVKRYKHINNGSTRILAEWLSPIQITRKNYKSLLIESGIISSEDLQEVTQ